MASTPKKSAKPTARKGALAAGAARASGERAKRRSTPLIASTGAEARVGAATTASATPTTSPRTTTSTTTTTATTKAQASVATGGKHRPRPVAKAVPTRKAVSRSGARTPAVAKPPRTPRAGTGARKASTRHTAEPKVRALKAVTDETVVPVAVAEPPTSRSVAPGIEELLTAGIAAVRVAAEAAGISSDDVERHLASLLSFVRRRVTGDYTVDEFGFDEDFTRHFYLPVLRPLYRSWFRVEVRGIENIPSEGGGLVVANHSGTIAMDSLMTQVAVHDEHPAHRHLRMLGADLVFQTPVVGQLARRSGSTLAANPDAERLLSGGELCGVWPEGFKGVGKPFSERYKLQRFGRGGFVSAALKTGVPIIPCSIIGAEEIYPIIGNMKTVARLFGAPYAPITPTWPLLGPLGLIPLPSKWIIEFGAPVETADLGPGAADDPMLVFDLTDQVRETIQQTLYSLLMQRRSVFF
ncbi:1-acyl-sn-glycerol-3-phosphate acyltransferase [Phycicoccus badiiscoriae]|uniref:1-acyl-sn-glycerol-3-phosphate acyltransferase n=1 Tax=Pedococcus badiiscoriae TaxID=642776 RepID=A0A852WM12_9MICO|nr:lysophospholipid acyltransferase family protein [Pedococcus badiiscoriae]NYG06486.1 1-acyl-sn-glycerol-3-phosphate acyltransferase [Pedococcus badiiscoriae]